MPEHKEPLFTRVVINTTIWGKLTTLFFKPSKLRIIFILKDGSKRQFRLVASMAKSDFLLSPLVENTYDFSLLFGKSDALSEKKVKSIVIRSESDNRQWNKSYTIYFNHINNENNNVSPSA